jgi:hypothetical protein
VFSFSFEPEALAQLLQPPFATPLAVMGCSLAVLLAAAVRARFSAAYRPRGPAAAMAARKSVRARDVAAGGIGIGGGIASRPSNSGSGPGGLAGLPPLHGIPSVGRMSAHSHGGSDYGAAPYFGSASGLSVGSPQPPFETRSARTSGFGGSEHELLSPWNSMRGGIPRPGPGGFDPMQGASEPYGHMHRQSLPGNVRLRGMDSPGGAPGGGLPDPFRSSGSGPAMVVVGMGGDEAGSQEGPGGSLGQPQNSTGSLRGFFAGRVMQTLGSGARMRSASENGMRGARVVGIGVAIPQQQQGGGPGAGGGGNWDGGSASPGSGSGSPIPQQSGGSQSARLSRLGEGVTWALANTLGSGGAQARRSRMKSTSGGAGLLYHD